MKSRILIALMAFASAASAAVKSGAYYGTAVALSGTKSVTLVAEYDP